MNRTPMVTHGTQTGRTPLHAPNVKEITRVGSWPNCPKCGHSATGVYAGKFACRRDGWVEGQRDDKGLFS